VTTTLDTDVLIIGSGAGGAVTAARLTRAGRTVTIVEEGPWVDPDATEPFSLEEMVRKYRYGGPSAALGRPAIAFAEGRCVGGSTEINSGLYHRLPSELAREWQRTYRIDEFGPDALDRYAAGIEEELAVSRLPGAPPTSSAMLEQGATKLGWQAVEFSRVFRYEPNGRAVKQTMARTMLPRAIDAGAQLIADCRVSRLLRRGKRITGAHCARSRADGTVEQLVIRADHVFVCAGATQTPTLLQRSGIRKNIGHGLKMHPTVKIAARFPHPIDHGEVPMHRVTEFAPSLTIGGSASRRGHVALALADSGAEYADALANWENVAVYYAAIRSDGGGRVFAVPGLRAPVLTYNLTEGDMSRLARALVHLGEVLLAAGATELYPSVTGGVTARGLDDLVQWWDAMTRNRANLMTVHLTSSVRIGEDDTRTGTDSFGRVWGYTNLRVNDASLIPDAPGVNPQGPVMAIAARNSDHFLAAS
jgi:choline dehydrogenase-like flavoprotein